MPTANLKLIDIAKTVFFKLEQYDFTKRFLIYSLIIRKQFWKNKDSKSLVTNNSSEIPKKNVKLITGDIILFNGKVFKKSLNNYIK